MKVSYYLTLHKINPVLRFIIGRPLMEQVRIFAQIQLARACDRIRNFGEKELKAVNVSGKLWELTVGTGDQYGLFFTTLSKNEIRLLHHRVKDKKKGRKKDINLALNRLKEVFHVKKRRSRRSKR